MIRKLDTVRTPRVAMPQEVARGLILAMVAEVQATAEKIPANLPASEANDEALIRALRGLRHALEAVRTLAEQAEKAESEAEDGQPQTLTLK